MKSIIFDKEYEELTRDELRRESSLQRWILKIVSAYKRKCNYKMESHIEKTEVRDGLGEEYINGLITSKEYVRERMRAGKENYFVHIWRDRTNFCENAERVLVAEIAKINDMLENKEEKKEPKARKKYKKRESQHYDPRKRVSKNNYPHKKQERVRRILEGRKGE